MCRRKISRLLIAFDGLTLEGVTLGESSASLLFSAPATGLRFCREEAATVEEKVLSTVASKFYP